MHERELYERARKLFERVVDLTAEEQERVLRQESDEAGGAIVVERVRGQLAADAEWGADEPLDPRSLLGTAIGNYEVLDIIDAGGMGVVYRGRRQDPTEEVAIKVLSVGPLTAERIERFETEIELLASCDHPGIVRYRDSGKLEGGRPYLIMDLVDGSPLSARDDAVRAGVTETVELALRAAGALQHLHTRPALHRDLKPSNILVTKGSDGPQPVLIDLGIARRLDETAEQGLTLDRVIGTPAFMSPEQAGGKKVHATADVYGFGALLYLLLTGHPPRGLDEVKDFEEERRRLASPAAAPSERVDAKVFGEAAAQRRARQMRGDLDAIVLAAIETDPKDRYQSVEALRADLYRWLSHRPIVARPISPVGRAWRLARRYPKRIALGLGLLLFLSTTSLVTWRSLVELRHTKEGLEEQLGTNAAVRDFLIKGVFQAASPELQGPETPVREIVHSAADSIGQSLDDRPAVLVGLRSALVSVFSTMGDLERAREQVTSTAPLAAELAPTHPQRMEFDVEVGFLAQHEGRSDEAVEQLRDVLARIRRAEEVAPTLLSRALAALGLALYGANELEEALLVYEEALELVPTDDQSRWSLMVTIGALVSELHGRAAALPQEEELHQALHKQFGPQHVYVMAQASNLAETYLELDRPQEALSWSREALTIADANFAPDDLLRLTVLNNYASGLSAMRKFERAIPVRREVFEQRRRILGEESSAVARAASNLASTLFRAGRHGEAFEPARSALRSHQARGQLDHPDAASAYHVLGAAHAALGSVPEAIEAYDRAIEIWTEAAGDHATDLAKAKSERAKLTQD